MSGRGAEGAARHRRAGARAIARAAAALGAAALAIAVALAPALSGCGGDDNPMPPAPPDPFFPADFLATYTQVRGCRLGVDHDLHFIQVYINPEAAEAYTDSIYPFAVGTVCVKPEYSMEDQGCGEQPIGYSAMRKGAPGTAPAVGDWEWQFVGPDRRVAEYTPAQVEACISCHTDCTNGRDFMCTDP
jgi:hypothetical protein